MSRELQSCWMLYITTLDLMETTFLVIRLTISLQLTKLLGVCQKLSIANYSVLSSSLTPTPYYPSPSLLFSSFLFPLLGPALNVDLSTSSKDTLYAPHVRQFLISNAVYWLKEFHIDGLRLDATHTIIDLSSPHILQELALTCKSLRPSFRLFAEDER
jgi:hypothetical protein